MPDSDRLLREARSVLLVDWPSRDVPDTLARSGRTVVAQEGPDRYVAYEVEGDEVVALTAGGPPERVDLVYAYRPLDELEGIVELAASLGAGAIWLESDENASPSIEELGMARGIVEAAGLVLIAEPRLADAVRSLEGVEQ